MPAHTSSSAYSCPLAWGGSGPLLRGMDQGKRPMWPLQPGSGLYWAEGRPSNSHPPGRHTQGSRSCDDRGRDRSEAVTSQGTLRTSSRPRSWKRQEGTLPQGPWRGHGPLTPDFRLRLSELREQISVALSRPGCGPSFWQPQEANTGPGRQGLLGPHTLDPKRFLPHLRPLTSPSNRFSRVPAGSSWTI